MSDLIERLKAGVPCSGSHSTADDVDAATGTMREAATALAEKDARIAALEAERDEARAECEGLRAALIWYENNVAGCRLIHSGGDAHRAALAADGGTRARVALCASGPPRARP